MFGFDCKAFEDLSELFGLQGFTVDGVPKLIDESYFVAQAAADGLRGDIR